MPISQSTLRSYSATRGIFAETATLAKAERKKTAFLCHSHLDEALAERVQSFLQLQGWMVYIDWQDASMPPKPTRQTAEKIQAKIIELDWFLFLATENSMSSKWCPWELGYADGKKGRSPIAVIPTSDGRGVIHGAEYMVLYKRIDTNASGRWAIIDVDQSYGKELVEV